VGSNPWALPNPAVVLLILMIAMAGIPGLSGYGVVVLVRGRRQREGVLRGLASVAAAATLAIYSFGVLTMFPDETLAAETCQDAVGPAHAANVTSYETSFVPLRFGCHVEGVGTWNIFVPGWVNPTVLALLLLTVVLLALTRLAARTAPVTTTTGGAS
jgi:formate hydrogenlyase subunit 3/multisubunit Na+/H+ antiporter MnhD subunit